MPRRRDLGRAAFRAYYEGTHAPLAVPLFPFLRYRRNHLTDPAIEPGFDCVGEFWISSLAAIGAVMAGAGGAIMLADERNFMHQPDNVAARADEVLIGDDAATLLLPIHDEGGDRAALVEACRVAGVGLDLLTSLDDRPLPCDALARIGATKPGLPPGWRAGPVLDVELCETDPATLRG